MNRPSFASPMERLAARLLDILLLIVLMVVSVMLAGAMYRRQNAGGGGLMILLGLIVYAVLQAVLLSQSGQTVGKKAMAIRVADRTTGRNGGFLQNVLLRSWVNTLIGVIPFYKLVDALFILREDRRCIHDLIADTVVVRRSS